MGSTIRAKRLGVLTNTFAHSDLAACIGAPDEWFFPVGGNGRGSYKEARKICMRCPVRVACLEWELQYESPSTARAGMGMFGGKTPRERAEILQQRKKGYNMKPGVWGVGSP